jgi:DNA-directed RNA polymerase subunit beta'
MGRLLFNEPIPQDLGFVDRTKRENVCNLEIDELVKKGTLSDIIDRCIKVHGSTRTSIVLDEIKRMGFEYSTRGAITVSIEDIVVPPEKNELIKQADAVVDKIVRQYRRGLITEDERYANVIKVWTQTIDNLTQVLKESMGMLNPINMMSDSGARGNINQIKQLAGMRGLMSDTSGKTLEIPIKANFREGLDVLEFFISSHGTRKTLSDTALRTADSGYLTRRLVDVSQEVIIRMNDCGTEDYIEISPIMSSDDADAEPIVPLSARITGRYIAEDIVHPESGELLAKKGDLLSDLQASAIEKAGHDTVKIRSVLVCDCEHGVCAKCYGSNLATNEPCNIGDAIGIIAAQSIGEPGTQLTMRTFHTGGVATADDITQGLPRVEELFEARKPKGLATISELDGIVSFSNNGKKVDLTITSDDGESKTLSFIDSTKFKVSEGDHVNKGDFLVEGSINPHDILRILGVYGVQKYIIEEVQRVYNMQGVKINDRHIEVIVRQMLRKVKVDEPGDTPLLPGSIVNIHEFEAVNRRAESLGKTPAIGKRVLLGITKASLATDSFLSAASFQETTRVLTEAAIKQKKDPLLGLKENVIIGKLIPAGTGMSRYKDIEIMVERLDDGVEDTIPTKQIADEEDIFEEVLVDDSGMPDVDDFDE